MKSMIVAFFVVLAVAIVNAGILAPSPLIASPLGATVVSSPVIGARSLVSPWSAGIVAPGISPLALSGSVVAPGVVPTIW